MNEIILSLAYMVFLFILLLVIVNWPSILAFFRRVGDIANSLAESYCDYEEELTKLTPEERAYLYNDTNLFI